MNAPLILLHPEALRGTHPVFQAAPLGTAAIFVWDDAYWRAANYSLKRLIFIYETLCELPVTILHGTVEEVVKAYAPSMLYVPATHNPLLAAEITRLAQLAPLQWVADEPFVVMQFKGEMRRFFPYWKKAERKAFLPHGGAHD